MSQMLRQEVIDARKPSAIAARVFSVVNRASPAEKSSFQLRNENHATAIHLRFLNPNAAPGLVASSKHNNFSTTKGRYLTQCSLGLH